MHGFGAKAELDQCLSVKGASLILQFWAYIGSHWPHHQPPILRDALFYHWSILVPLFVIVKDGVVVDKFEGANPANLAQKVAKFVGSPLPKKVIEIEEVIEKAPVDKSVLLKKKLEGIVASKPVMFFMNGSPSKPKCGFSRKDILTEYNIDIGSFDIMRD